MNMHAAWSRLQPFRVDFHDQSAVALTNDHFTVGGAIRAGHRGAGNFLYRLRRRFGFGRFVAATGCKRKSQSSQQYASPAFTNILMTHDLSPQFSVVCLTTFPW